MSLSSRLRVLKHLPSSCFSLFRRALFSISLSQSLILISSSWLDSPLFPNVFIWRVPLIFSNGKFSTEGVAVVNGRTSDEDTAPFHESVTVSATLCMMIEHGNRLAWSGHKDGKIRAWKMDQLIINTAEDSKPLKERLSWQAHPSPVNYISAHMGLWIL